MRTHLKETEEIILKKKPDLLEMAQNARLYAKLTPMYRGGFFLMILSVIFGCTKTFENNRKNHKKKTGPREMAQNARLYAKLTPNEDTSKKKLKNHQKCWVIFLLISCQFCTNQTFWTQFYNPDQCALKL